MRYVVIATCLWFFSAWAQEPQMIDINDPTHIVRQGKIFTVRMVPGAKTTSFYVAGNKAADLKLEKLNVKATAYGPGAQQRQLDLVRRDRYYETTTLFPDAERVQFEIEQPPLAKPARPSSKESLDFQLKSNP